MFDEDHYNHFLKITSQSMLLIKEINVILKSKTEFQQKLGGVWMIKEGSGIVKFLLF